MNATLFRQLIAKDLYMTRFLLVGAVISGLGSLVLCTQGPVGFTFGSITFMTTLIALGVMSAMYGVFEERKDRSYLFILSLPLSGRDYVKAKMLGSLLTFMIPWAILTVAAVAILSMAPAIPHGLAPMSLLVCFYCLLNTCVLIAVTLLIRSEGVVAGCIVLTNLLVSFFLFTLARIPGIAGSQTSMKADWNQNVFIVLVVVLVLIGCAIALPLRVYSRKRDLV